MDDKFMYIYNENSQSYPFCRNNKWFKRLDTQLNEPTSQIWLKVPKVIKPTNKKYYKNFGD